MVDKISLYNPKWLVCKILTACLLVFIVSPLLNSCAQNQPQNTQATEVIYSHRGASGEETEHTFAAYDLALAYGSHYIELDVVSSKENGLFVAHDETAERVTGDKRHYAEMNDAEISKLRTIKNNEPIHTLAEVLDRYGKTTNYVVELRGANQVEPFLSEITTRDLSNNMIVQAKNIDILASCKEVFPNMQTLLIVEDENLFNAGLASNTVDILGLNKNLVNASRVKQVHAANKACNAWTINSISEMEEMLALDVDSFFTNYTAKAFAVINDKL